MTEKFGEWIYQIRKGDFDDVELLLFTKINCVQSDLLFLTNFEMVLANISLGTWLYHQLCVSGDGNIWRKRHYEQEDFIIYQKDEKSGNRTSFQDTDIAYWQLRYCAVEKWYATVCLCDYKNAKISNGTLCPVKFLRKISKLLRHIFGQLSTLWLCKPSKRLTFNS